MAARPDFDIKKMYPELFQEEPAPEAEISGTGEVTPDDYKNVEWSSPKDAAEEWERISAMLAQNHGALTGDEVVGAPSGDIEWTDWR